MNAIRRHGNRLNLLQIHDCVRKMCTLQAPQALMYKNPCLDLQQYLEIPIFKAENFFNPSLKSMQCSQELFVPTKHHSVTCIAKVVDPKEFPEHDLPEIAFIGRSNAGKTSLLKAIFQAVPELRFKTSKKPGMTKSLNFYQIGSSLCLVDMPGYGFRAPKWFKESAIHYLKNRRNLTKTFLLIDGTEGFHSWDDGAMQMLGDMKIPFAIILTKIDAMSDSQRLKNFLHVQKIKDDFQLNTCLSQIFMLSSHSFEGMAYFTTFLTHITGSMKTEAS